MRISVRLLGACVTGFLSIAVAQANQRALLIGVANIPGSELPGVDLDNLSPAAKAAAMR